MELIHGIQTLDNSRIVRRMHFVKIQLAGIAEEDLMQLAGDVEQQQHAPQSPLLSACTRQILQGPLSLVQEGASVFPCALTPVQSRDDEFDFLQDCYA